MSTTLPPHPSADPVTTRILQLTARSGAGGWSGRLRRPGPVPGRDDLRTRTLDDLRTATGRTG